MSYAQKPCAQCGGRTFRYLPNMQLHFAVASTMMGLNVSAGVGRLWTFTLVICDGCGGTQMFTTNAAQLAQYVAGAGAVTATDG